jgi:hypothetical protein
MGSLKPGATYIYERVDNRVYAREFGETKRTLVGIELRQQESSTHKRMLSEMNEVLIMCETDPEMKELLDRLLVVYNLKKKDSPVAYHPV